MKLIDVSSNNVHPINWGAVKADPQGVVGVFVKATEGTGYRNPFYTGDMAGARAVGLAAVAYHFIGGGNPQAEAAFFRSVAGPDAKVLDSETNTDEAWQQAFLSALNLPAYEEMDYGSVSAIQTGLRALLWGAAYGGKPGPDETVFQFTETGRVDGINGNVDISQWLGTQEQFDAFFGTATPVAPSNPTEAQTMVSPAVSQGGSTHVFQVSDGTLWHKWSPSPGNWGNESVGVAAKIPSSVTFPDQTPQVAILGEQMIVTVEDATKRAWLFAQAWTAASGSSPWGVAELP